MGRPAHFAAGLRYEKTDVTSSAQVPIATRQPMGGCQRGQHHPRDAPAFTTLKGSYNFALPNLDFDVDLMPNLKARASWGKSIGRPSWGAIQGGQILDSLARPGFGTGSQGNPALKPLESKNIDLALEWYYAKGSYVSVGYFKKNVTQLPGHRDDQRDAVQHSEPGRWVRGCRKRSRRVVARRPTAQCIRNYIITTHAGDPAVIQPTGTAQGIIVGRPGIDPDTDLPHHHAGRVRVPTASMAGN